MTPFCIKPCSAMALPRTGSSHSTRRKFIYEFHAVPSPTFFALGTVFRKSEPLIRGEVDWINYLAEGGVSVSRAIHSESGNLVEPVEDRQGGHFLVTAFVKAQGQRPWDLWTPTLYETYGELLGKMACAYRKLSTPKLAWKRPEWDDDIFEFVESYLPASESIAKKKCASCPMRGWRGREQPTA